MRITALLATVLCLLATHASARDVRISEDRGGQIGKYLITYGEMRHNGDQVIVDGNCLSACTLILGMIPRDRICATERARFGFHAAWMPAGDGTIVTSKLGTEALWVTYASDIRRWIGRHGGLKRKMIFLQGAEVYRYVRSCDAPVTAEVTRSAASRRHLARTANARAR